MCGFPQAIINTVKARCLRIALLAPALILIAASAIMATDISGLMEKRGPIAKEVVTRPTITRVMELPGLPVSLKQCEFLLDHPRLSMVLAHIYDTSLDSYKVNVRSDGIIHVDDLPMLAGDAELVQSIPGRRIYFITGYFDILKMRFHGHMVMMISYSQRQGEARDSLDSTTTGYIKVKGPFLGFFAKIVAFLFPKKVDERIGRFGNAVRKVAVAVYNDPAGAYSRLSASGEVSLQELDEFSEMFLRRPQSPP
jgi:hypothetical protein